MPERYLKRGGLCLTPLFIVKNLSDQNKTFHFTCRLQKTAAYCWILFFINFMTFAIWAESLAFLKDGPRKNVTAGSLWSYTWNKEWHSQDHPEFWSRITSFRRKSRICESNERYKTRESFCKAIYWCTWWSRWFCILHGLTSSQAITVRLFNSRALQKQTNFLRNLFLKCKNVSIYHSIVTRSEYNSDIFNFFLQEIFITHSVVVWLWNDQRIGDTQCVTHFSE